MEESSPQPRLQCRHVPQVAVADGDVGGGRRQGRSSCDRWGGCRGCSGLGLPRLNCCSLGRCGSCRRYCCGRCNLLRSEHGYKARRGSDKAPVVSLPAEKTWGGGRQTQRAAVAPPHAALPPAHATAKDERRQRVKRREDDDGVDDLVKGPRPWGWRSSTTSSSSCCCRSGTASRTAN